MWRGFAGREALRLLYMPWISEPWHAACRAQGSTAVQVLFFTFPSNGRGGLPAALGPQHWDGDEKSLVWRWEKKLERVTCALPVCPP